MTKLFRKNILEVSVLCALGVIVLYSTVAKGAEKFSVTSSSGDAIREVNNYVFQSSGQEPYYSVYGAKSTGDGLVSENQIIVQTDIDWAVEEQYPPEFAGGYSEKGTAQGNTVIVSNTDIFDVFGGKSKNNGSAIGNVVQVGSGVKAGIWIGKSNKAPMVYALIAGGMVQNDSSASVVASNQVVIDATDSSNKDNYVHLVIGGQARGKQGVSAIENSVNFIRGHVVQLIGGDSWYGNAEGNTLVIFGGLVATQDGLSNGSVYGGLAPKGAALKNTVSISGGKLIGDIYGGKGEIEASDNLIEVSDNPDLSMAGLFGGDAPISQNNTLSIKTSGIVVQQIGNFQNLQFEVTRAVGSTPIVKVIGNQATDITNSIVKVTLNQNTIPLKKGQEIVLLENVQTIATEGLQGSIDYENPEGLLDYGLSLNVTDKTLGVLVCNVETKPESKSILSANLSRIAFVNQGSDLLVGQGIVAGREAEENGRHLFVALQTGSNHYNIDSYIDLEGESVLVGSVWPVEAFGSKVTLGGFIESGWGDYEVENALTAQSAIKGQGETHYRGAGLLAYWSESPLAEQGLYAEASMRLGRADISYLSVASSLDVNYDVKGTYWAGHLGLGYRHQFNDENHADLYTKFFYSHQDSDSFVIDRNTVQMDTIESMRWRTGLSYRHRGFTPEGCVFDWQAALAYEYEFDGKAKGSIDGYRILDSELQGSTGIGEVSITFLPSRDSGTRVRASLQGFVGTREGYIGQIQWTETF